MTSLAPSSLRARREESPSPQTPTLAWEQGELRSESNWSRCYAAWPEGDSSGSLFLLKAARIDLATERECDLSRSLLSREVAVSRSLRHRHVASILDADLTSDEPWLVQPATGEPLLSSLAGASLVERLWTIRQIADALQAMHHHGWLHGNVSPESMVVAPEGHATLTELGWSRRLASEECDLAHTDFAGTVRYAAPELFDDHGQLTSAADIYSLGAVLYELLSDRPLLDRYVGRSLIAAKRMLSASELTPPAGVPYRVASLLARMLARDPLRRPSASEVIESLVAAEVVSFGEWAHVG